MSLLEGVTSQYIDQSGKTRMLCYDNGLNLITSPLPPMNIRSDSYNTDGVIYKIASEFLKKYSFIITLQEVENNQVKGIWIEPNQDSDYFDTIFYGYIPLVNTKPLEGVTYSHCLEAPLTFMKDSELEKYRQTRKIAYYIQQYTLFEYSRRVAISGEINFDDLFIIVPNHDYSDIKALNNLFIPDHPVMFKNERLICTDIKMRDNLIGYLKAQLLNDRDGVLFLHNTNVISGYYNNFADYDQSPDQLIFLDQNSIVEWLKKRETSIITGMGIPADNVKIELDLNTDKPYFYRNEGLLDNSLVVIQTVLEGNLSRAVKLGQFWIKNGVNTGYNTPEAKNIKDAHYVVLQMHKGLWKESTNVNLSENQIYVLKHSKGYTAILKISSDIDKTQSLKKSEFDPVSVEPYFYRNEGLLDNSLVIIQNVFEGNIDGARRLGYKWSRDKINSGYNTSNTKIPSNIKTDTVILEKEDVKWVVISGKIDLNKNQIYLLQYPKLSNEKTHSYACILKI